MLSVSVEGWRFLPHSYAIVNQFQLLELLKRNDVVIHHRDMPFYQPHWRVVRGLFSPEEERLLENISGPSEDFDSVLRMTYPYNLQPAEGKKLFVFMTVEFGHVLPCDVNGLLADLADNVHIITCSSWSKEGILRSGAKESQVSVVPHGVDHLRYRPVDKTQRKLLRQKYKVDDRFVFFHAGAMTANKGIVLLLKAFARVVRKYPQSCLMLKGLDSLYGSQKLLQQIGDQLSEEEKKAIGPKIKYVGGTFSFDEMAELYQLSDVYVSPYMGEGFNMPVLEAVASGLPVICTKGGPTDEFTTEQFALPVAARKLPGVFAGVHGYYLQPDLECLVQQMEQAFGDASFRVQACAAGPAFVTQGFQWAQIVKRLTDVMKK